MNTRALLLATAGGTIFQLAMVLVGHTTPSMASLFAVLGMTISLVAGVAYARVARPVTRGNAAIGGLLAGGICAIIGIFVSYRLGDVPAAILGFGTASSAVTGALGGFLGTLGGQRATA